jgi:very-short-patch-repair endonuclease
MHVACKAHDARLRGPRDSRIRIVPSDPVRVHWREMPATGSRLLLDPLESLRDATGCVDAESLAVMADSALHTHPGLLTEWRAFCESVPSARRAPLLWADGICESGIETLTWLRIRSLPVDVRRQVRIGQIGRVDFVVGERLVIEVDGEEYHTDPRQFESDRARDALLAARGYIVLRFSYRQVTQRWTEVAAAVEGMIRRGAHRGP